MAACGCKDFGTCSFETERSATVPIEQLEARPLRTNGLRLSFR